MQQRMTPSQNRGNAGIECSRTPLVALAWLTLLAGCAPAGMPMTELPPQVAYTCQQGGPLTVLRAADGRQAEVIVPGRRFVLPRVDSAAQEKYTNGRAALYLEGENAVLTEDSLVLAGRCASTVSLPVVEQYRY
jgi:membrane-bound inhibitor of C-type lysozyme